MGELALTPRIEDRIEYLEQRCREYDESAEYREELCARLVKAESALNVHNQRITKWFSTTQAVRASINGLVEELDLRVHRLETAVDLRPGLHEDVKNIATQMGDVLEQLVVIFETVEDFEDRSQKITAALSGAAALFNQAVTFDDD